MKTRIFCTLLLTALTLAATAGLAGAQSFQQALAGKRLVLKGAQCAGWEFKDASTALRYDEMVCSRGGEPSFQTRVLWITKDQFLLIESSRESANPNCPPRIWMYRVESLSASKAALKETWLGWGKGKDSLESYRIQQ